MFPLEAVERSDPGQSRVTTHRSSANQPLTSAITCTGADASKHTRPPTPGGTTTAFATAPPTPKFTDDTHGTAPPQPNTVKNPARNAPVTVTFNDNPPTPDDGTPPTPTNPTDNNEPGTTRPARTASEPSRVSNNRDAATGLNPAPSANQPLMSAIT